MIRMWQSWRPMVSRRLRQTFTVDLQSPIVSEQLYRANVTLDNDGKPAQEDLAAWSCARYQEATKKPRQASTKERVIDYVPTDKVSGWQRYRRSLENTDLVTA